MYLVVNDAIYRYHTFDRLAFVDVYWTNSKTAQTFIRVEHGTPSLTDAQILDAYPELLL